MRQRARLVALLSGSLLSLASWSARAENLIKQPGVHPDYFAELEPHFMFALDPPGGKAGQGYGPGFRASFNVVDKGFISKLNDSVAVGAGFDWIAFTKQETSVWVPIVMQWNFWFTDVISVFGEPGFGFYLGNATGVRPTISGGARFHLADRIAITARAGYPAFSLGVSFFL